MRALVTRRLEIGQCTTRLQIRVVWHRYLLA